MGLLDTLLNTRLSKRREMSADYLRAIQPQVVAMNREKGFMVSTPDNRVSSELARFNVRQTTGRVPAAMYRYSGIETIIPNKAGQKGYDDFDRAVKAGIKPGSSLTELQDALFGKRSDNRALTKSNQNNNDNDYKNNATLRQAVSGVAGSPTAPNPSQVSMNQGYKAGYAPDVNNELDYLQFELFTNRAHSDFMRLLHDSLY